MSLTQKARAIYEKLLRLRDNTAISLVDKGVEILNTEYTLNEIPGYIDKIFQSDFEFFFNFRDVDQFGNPHVLKSGHASGGLGPLDFQVDVTALPQISIAVDAPVFQAPARGQFGYWRGTCNYAPGLTISNVVVQDLKISQYPETFSPIITAE